MTDKRDQSNLGQSLTMSPDRPKPKQIFDILPIRPFPDEPAEINRALAILGYDQNAIAFESEVSRQAVSAFIYNTCHSPRVALWFEKHGLYLDRDYPNPLAKLNLLERATG